MGILDQREDTVNFFLDTEFIETETNVYGVSIGLVSELGKSYYAIFDDFVPATATDWHKENLFKHLPPVIQGSIAHQNFIRNDLDGAWFPEVIPNNQEAQNTNSLLWKNSATIAYEISKFIVKECCDLTHLNGSLYATLMTSKEKLETYELDKKPVLWGWYPTSDFYLFYRLWGRLIDVPEHFPNRINDLKMLYNLFGNPDAPEKEPHHIAIDGAFWVKNAYDHLLQNLVSNAVDINIINTKSNMVAADENQTIRTGSV